jgi:2-hydroxy-3-oxopropionate reductase
MSDSRMSKVAVIGLGLMGLPITKNLLKAGYEVEIWSRSDLQANEAIAAGANRVGKLEDINAHTVLTVLPGIDPVLEVLQLGLNQALKSGDILVVMGTTAIQAMVDLASSLSTRGVKVVDAPMSGGDAGAKAATMSIMVGAEPEIFDELLPLFQKIGGTIRLIGPVGSGQLTKAANQVIVAINTTALGEAVTLARRSGLDTTAVLDILASGLAGSNVLNFARGKIESRQYIPGGYAKFLFNDLNYALEAAKNSGTVLPITDQVVSLYQSLLANGGGNLDISAIIQEIEGRSEQ